MAKKEQGVGVRGEGTEKERRAMAREEGKEGGEWGEGEEGKEGGE